MAKSQSKTAKQKKMPMRPFSASLPMALLRSREAVMCLFRPELRKHGITEQQWRVLRALAHFGSMEVSDLAQATFLLAPSLSRILPTLEQRGLIRRAEHEVDHRRTVVSLDSGGERVIAAHAPVSEKLYDLIAERFGPKRVEELLALLGELQDSLEDLWPEQARQTRKKRSRK